MIYSLGVQEDVAVDPQVIISDHMENQKSP